MSITVKALREILHHAPDGHTVLVATDSGNCSIFALTVSGYTTQPDGTLVDNQCVTLLTGDVVSKVDVKLVMTEAQFGRMMLDVVEETGTKITEKGGFNATVVGAKLLSKINRFFSGQGEQ